MFRDIRWLVLAACLLVGLTHEVQARVVRFEISERVPFDGGKKFGSAGAFEMIKGKVFFAINPKLDQNQPVVDLSRAAVSKTGEVEFDCDLFIVAPVDPTLGNGTLFYDVNNRGNKVAMRFFNEGPAGNDLDGSGNGFLQRQGFTVVWSGWDGELLPGNHRLQLRAPVATEQGKPITGRVRCEFVPAAETKRNSVINWVGHGSYRPTEKGLKEATLTVREFPDDPRVPISRDQFEVVVTAQPNDAPAQLPQFEVSLKSGFKTGHLYELIYEAHSPLVHGVCFTGVRDLMTALKHGEGEGNPLSSPQKKPYQRAIGFGVSQSGRFLREFLHEGFNQDEQGRKVFDALIPHVSGGGLGSFNHRFAQPTRHCTQHDHADYPADRFPFTYATQTDPVSKQTDGILKKAIATRTAPYVLHTQSAAEYWTRAGSLVHTDPLGQRDAEIPDNVRIYQFGGTQHGPAGYPSTKGMGQNLTNPGDYRPFLRALLVAADRWCRDGVSAPPSVYPKIADGTLVPFDQKSTQFPGIPGVRYPQVIRQPKFLDWGPRWHSERIADFQPPRQGESYGVRVARCDADGNERGCLLPPEVTVPLATYTGWNLRRADMGGENDLVSLMGSYLPFPLTKADREQSNDPRRSIAERYQSVDHYHRALQETCRKLQSQGYLLAEDADSIPQIHQQRAVPIFEKMGAK